ncbi:hypothetical protein GX48_07656 [Paracoccidioides brasiliensis]|nr:hypothetical protein GX48_07656 [Paracoccidioides brasiliensis]
MDSNTLTCRHNMLDLAWAISELVIKEYLSTDQLDALAQSIIDTLVASLKSFIKKSTE